MSTQRVLNIDSLIAVVLGDGPRHCAGECDSFMEDTDRFVVTLALGRHVMFV